MRHRYLITITNTKGFRQFRLWQIVKWLIPLGLVLVVLIGVATWLYLRHLESAYAKSRQQEAIQKERLMALSQEIATKEATLARLGERLSDLEQFVGEGGDTNISYAQRLNDVALSAAQLNLLFSIVPSGAPLPMEGVTSPFGWRTHPITKRREFHAGVDLRAKHHKPVWATADGVVEFAGFHRSSGYGNLVIIDHGFGFKSYYGHLHRTVVRRGDTVIKGDIVGFSGNTGRSTAPHLHYEIRYLSHPVNPQGFITWKKGSYRTIFRKVTTIPWASFIALINHVATQTLPPSSPPVPAS